MSSSPVSVTGTNLAYPVDIENLDKVTCTPSAAAWRCAAILKSGKASDGVRPGHGSHWVLTHSQNPDGQILDKSWEQDRRAAIVVPRETLSGLVAPRIAIVLSYQGKVAQRGETISGGIQSGPTGIPGAGYAFMTEGAFGGGFGGSSFADAQCTREATLPNSLLPPTVQCAAMIFTSVTDINPTFNVARVLGGVMSSLMLPDRDIYTPSQGSPGGLIKIGAVATEALFQNLAPVAFKNQYGALPSTAISDKYWVGSSDSDQRCNEWGGNGSPNPDPVAVGKVTENTARFSTPLVTISCEETARAHLLCFCK